MIQDSCLNCFVAANRAHDSFDIQFLDKSIRGSFHTTSIHLTRLAALGTAARRAFKAAAIWSPKIWIISE